MKMITEPIARYERRRQNQCLILAGALQMPAVAAGKVDSGGDDLC